MSGAGGGASIGGAVGWAGWLGWAGSAGCGGVSGGGVAGLGTSCMERYSFNEITLIAPAKLHVSFLGRLLLPPRRSLL